MDVTFSDMTDDASMDMEIEKEPELCRFPRRHSAKSKKLCAREERNASIKRVSLILQKSEQHRTLEETQTLQQCTEEVEEVQSRWKKRDEAKRRLEEFEEPLETLQEKCQILAQAIAQSQHLVVYTGAGISTAARIPDYRGTNGIWTRLQQGKEIGNHDLSLAEPTYTHMALSQLYHQNILKHVVSQNCDGLHLRSGLPRYALSELHGNMYIEVCKSCKPTKEYYRQFDVTENTARYSHKTMRKCYVCNEPLVDTIVHFGERGTLQWPLNWSGASKNAQKATTILCLGSSLKVLKRYPWLWQMDKPIKKRPNLYIINLQWTPKDDFANIKIHGKCDVVMKIVMNFLGIMVKPYDRFRDPIFYHSTQLCSEELHTTTQPALKCNEVNGSDEFVNCVKIESSEDEEKVTKEEEHSSGLQIKSALHVCDNTSTGTDTSSKIKSDNVSVSNNCLNQSLIINKNGDKTFKIQEFNHQRCNFSIDSILQGDTKSIKLDNAVKRESFTDGADENLAINSNFLNNAFVLPQNYHAFVAYYRFREAVLLQNPILSYQDMLYYPYQTSFLYSGFHSIINSFPHLHNNSKLNSNDAKVLDNNKVTKSDEPIPESEIVECTFCRNEFKSMTCLFYTQTEPIFVKKDYESDSIAKKPSVCLCCDYSSDEGEDVSNKKDGSMEDSDVNEAASTSISEKDSMEIAATSVSEKDGIETTATSLSEKDGMETAATSISTKDGMETDKEQMKVKIQAGWFGKGYRKNKKPRKR